MPMHAGHRYSEGDSGLLEFTAWREENDLIVSESERII